MINCRGEKNGKLNGEVLDCVHVKHFSRNFVCGEWQCYFSGSSVSAQWTWVGDVHVLPVYPHLCWQCEHQRLFQPQLCQCWCACPVTGAASIGVAAVGAQWAVCWLSKVLSAFRLLSVPSGCASALL